MPRSFQSRMARKDQDRLRTAFMRNVVDRQEEKNRVGPGIKMMGNVAISTPETRFNQEMDEAQIARNALKVERETAMREQDVTAQGQQLAHRAAMWGHNVNAQGHQLAHQADMRGHEVKAQENRFWRDATKRGQNIEQGLGYAKMRSDENIASMNRDATIGSSIVGALPKMTSDRVDATGMLRPPPSIENIQRTAQGISSAVYPQGEGSATPSGLSWHEPPYTVTPDEARTIATNAFHTLGKRAGEIGQQVSSMFANPDTLLDNLDKLLKDNRYSRKEKEAITYLVQAGYRLGDTKMFDTMIADILGTNRR